MATTGPLELHIIWMAVIKKAEICVYKKKPTWNQPLIFPISSEPILCPVASRDIGWAGIQVAKDDDVAASKPVPDSMSALYNLFNNHKKGPFQLSWFFYFFRK